MDKNIGRTFKCKKSYLTGSLFNPVTLPKGFTIRITDDRDENYNYSAKIVEDKDFKNYSTGDTIKLSKETLEEYFITVNKKVKRLK